MWDLVTEWQLEQDRFLRLGDLAVLFAPVYPESLAFTLFFKSPSDQRPTRV